MWMWLYDYVVTCHIPEFKRLKFWEVSVTFSWTHFLIEALIFFSKGKIKQFGGKRNKREMWKGKRIRMKVMVE